MPDPHRHAVAGRIMIGILILAFLMRAGLAWCGGQNFWGDEWHRWTSAWRIVDAIWSHHDAYEVGHTLASYIHMGLGFYAVGVPGILVHHALVPPIGDAHATAVAAIVVGGVGSLAVLVATALCARAFGASSAEVRYTTILASLTTCLMIWARHLTPYDWAFALALCALASAWSSRGGCMRGARTGALAVASLLTHYGVATMLPVIGAAFAWRHRERRAWIGAIIGASLIYVPAELLLTAYGLPATWLWTALQRAPQGDVAGGWMTPALYLWTTEHGLAVLWAAALLAIPWTGRRRPWLWPAVGACALLYGGMTLASSGLGILALTGRYVRLMAPFGCMLAAGLLASLRPSQRRLIVALCVLQAGYNLWRPFMMVFPSDIESRVVRSEGGWNRVRCAFTVRGPDTSTWRPPLDPDATRILVNTCAWLYPVTGLVQPPGRLVASWPHPLAYVPFQFEVFNAAERAILATADLTIQEREASDPAVEDCRCGGEMEHFVAIGLAALGIAIVVSIVTGLVAGWIVARRDERRDRTRDGT